MISSYFFYVFSAGAALSPSFMFCPREVKELIRRSRPGRTVLYMDNGQLEMPSVRSRALFGEMTALLMKKGLLVESRVVPGGVHSESSWERQIPFFLNTILYQTEEE